MEAAVAFTALIFSYIIPCLDTNLPIFSKQKGMQKKTVNKSPLKKSLISELEINQLSAAVQLPPPASQSSLFPAYPPIQLPRRVSPCCRDPS